MGSRFAYKNPVTARPNWYFINAKNVVVGRLASAVSVLLTGKHKPVYDRSVDGGDYVVVTNVKDVVFTGRKWKNKLYRWHSQWPGGLKEVPAWRMHEKSPEKILQRAVNGMLSKNRLRRGRMARLKLYSGEDHPHQAQEASAAPLPPHVKVSERPITTREEDWPGYIVSIEDSEEENAIIVHSKKVKEKNQKRKKRPPILSFDLLERKYFEKKDLVAPSSEKERPTPPWEITRDDV